MRTPHLAGLGLCLGLSLLASSPAGATTPQTINVDGNLADFDDATDRRPDDSGSDSAFSASNELRQLYVNWDASNLYIGFDYTIEQNAVMYLVQGAGQGGLTNFCNASAFQAAFETSQAMDVMVAFFGSGAPIGYRISGGNVTQDNSIQTARTGTNDGQRGAVEAAIPWSLLFPGASGTVTPGATIRIVGVVRGFQNGDAIADANPDSTLTGQGCAGNRATLSAYHEIRVDANGDGTPEPDWNPGSDTPLGDGGVPDAGVDAGPDATPDGPGPDGPASDTVGDVAPGDSAQTGDTGPGGDVPVGMTDDMGPRADGAAADRQLGDFPVPADRVLGATDGGGPPPPSTGCACRVEPGDGGAGPLTHLGGLVVLAWVLWAANRGRPRRR